MDITRATPSQAPAIERVARASWHATYDDVLGEEAVDAKVDAWYDIDDLRASIQREHHPLFVAVVDGTVVGFAQGGPTPEGPADTVVSRIYVQPDRWGAGIGTELLDRLTTALGNDGYADAWLHVLAENDVGRGFYEARGFVEVERHDTTMEGVTVEEAVMVREL